ncbi:outer membrane protein assembly factor BamB family protein [Actinoplanes derwentensis]|uniref:outer membrane protein assembly factor BamB family protein n=1 Tax=Actinoplanes derwentensis TaxID=113562 RepID=UPI000A5EBEC5|nr:PQQ-binding-like beta-propeller repeat protein [Actinoplanes derwentensis]GID83533.1 hypothetical protein Ade03nite_24570 [Actinoplanes derwentensis]
MSRGGILALSSVLVVVCAAAVFGVVTTRRGTTPAGLDGDGGTIAWTLDTTNGSGAAHVIGDTAVVLDSESLRGLDVADGSSRWRLPVPDQDSVLTVAGDMLAVQKGSDGPVDVVEAATGRIAWSTPGPVHMVARQDALYLDSCPDRRTPAAVCATVKRRGRPLVRRRTGLLSSGRRDRWTADAGSGRERVSAGHDLVQWPGGGCAAGHRDRAVAHRAAHDAGLVPRRGR